MLTSAVSYVSISNTAFDLNDRNINNVCFSDLRRYCRDDVETNVIQSQRRIMSTVKTLVKQFLTSVQLLLRDRLFLFRVGSKIKRSAYLVSLLRLYQIKKRIPFKSFIIV